jgi:hypothetical protein
MEQIIFYILQIVTILIILYLRSYFTKKANNYATIEDIKKISYEKQKGLNLATKEDIKDITKEIESVKTDFQSFINEQQIKFNILHPERVKFIMDLYSRIINLINTIKLNFGIALNSKIDNRNIVLNECSEKVKEIENYLYEKAILIDSNIYSKIYNFLQNIDISIKRIKTGLSFEGMGFEENNKELSQKGSKMVSKVLLEMDEKYPEILEELQFNFKEILGSEN